MFAERCKDIYLRLTAKLIQLNPLSELFNEKRSSFLSVATEFAMIK